MGRAELIDADPPVVAVVPPAVPAGRSARHTAVGPPRRVGARPGARAAPALRAVAGGRVLPPSLRPLAFRSPRWPGSLCRPAPHRPPPARRARAGLRRLGHAVDSLVARPGHWLFEGSGCGETGWCSLSRSSACGRSGPPPASGAGGWSSTRCWSAPLSTLAWRSLRPCVNLSSVDLGPFDGRAVGLWGNPVWLGAFLVGGLWIVCTRCPGESSGGGRSPPCWPPASKCRAAAPRWAPRSSSSRSWRLAEPVANGLLDRRWVVAGLFVGLAVHDRHSLLLRHGQGDGRGCRWPERPGRELEGRGSCHR